MKIVVVLPAYNCAKSLKKTISEIPQDVVNEIVLVDDFSSDDTIEVAKECCIRHIIKHDRNLGYGANQKTCYDIYEERHIHIICNKCGNIEDMSFQDAELDEYQEKLEKKMGNIIDHLAVCAHVSTCKKCH